MKWGIWWAVEYTWCSDPGETTGVCGPGVIGVPQVLREFPIPPPVPVPASYGVTTWWPEVSLGPYGANHYWQLELRPY